MVKNVKRKYEKPKVTRVSLDAKCAVLGFCKNTGQTGGGVPNCGVGVSPCATPGS